MQTDQPHKLLNSIYYFSEEISFKLKDEEVASGWILKSFEEEKKQLGVLNFIFCSDSYLHQLNVAYLSHDTLTDVITFPYHNKDEKLIEGDIFISIDRVKENAQLYNASFQMELYRVMIHGCLHLMGYFDNTEEDKKAMRIKEDYYLSLLSLQ